jgi:hypothetical protein
MPKDKDTKKTRGAKKVRKATKKQRRNKISKSGKPKGEEREPPPFHLPLIACTGVFFAGSRIVIPTYLPHRGLALAK